MEAIPGTSGLPEPYDWLKQPKQKGKDDMARIVADTGRCQGYANCVISAPHVFDIADNGKVTLLHEVVGDNEHGAVGGAVRSCPTAAIWVEEE